MLTALVDKNSAQCVCVECSKRRGVSDLTRLVDRLFAVGISSFPESIP